VWGNVYATTLPWRPRRRFIPTILFRTLRSKPLDGAQLDKLIDAIRKT
jgi:hypothetical protein